MRHLKGDLKQIQSLPLEVKVRMTQQRIRAWYDYWDSDVYVSFSGGKDSTVLKHIVDSMYDDVPGVFVNTGLEYPELRAFALRQKNTIRIDPKMKFYEVIQKYGYPVVSKNVSDCVYYAKKALEKDFDNNNFRLQRLNGTLLDGQGRLSIFNCSKWKFLLNAPFNVSAKCCDIMKKEPLKRYEKETGRKPIIGTMTHESLQRKRIWMKYGCNAFDKKNPASAPMSFWTEQDILQYIVENNLEIAQVYGSVEKKEDGNLFLTGEQRTGCMFCMFGCHLEKAPNRFQRMQQTHPKQYDYCMNKLKIGDVLDYIGVEKE